MSNRLEPESELGSDGELPEELAKMLKLDEDSNLEDQNLSEELEESSRFFSMTWLTIIRQWFSNLQLSKQRKSPSLEKLIELSAETLELNVEHENRFNLWKESRKIRKTLEIIFKEVQKKDKWFEENNVGSVKILDKNDILLILKIDLDDIFLKECHLVYDICIIDHNRLRSVDVGFYPYEEGDIGPAEEERYRKYLVEKGITAQDIALGFAIAIRNMSDDFFE